VVIRFLVFILLSAASFPGMADTARSHAEAEAEVRAVIDAFNASMASRDKERYLSLFADGPVRWQSVMDDFQLARERTRNPAATRAGFDPENTHITFIEKVLAALPDAAPPPVDDFPVRVDTDGDVATASQDYIFRRNGREAGNGRSYWMLVRTEQGWKITAVAYSKRGPAKPP